MSRPQISPPKPCLVTGGTGLLGSHIAERLHQRGDQVRALVRPGSDASFLEGLGAEILRGDLTDPEACKAATEGAEVVYHCAAKVGDWGNWKEFQKSCMDATRQLARSALSAGVRRFVHISSTSAYGHPKDPGYAIDETFPLGQSLWWCWDYYTRSKVECERILWRLAQERNLPLTIIRPSWLYGERDRTTVARLVGKLRKGGVPLIGWGNNPLSAVYAGNVADAAIMAANDPASEGEAYNITDQGRITQREFFRLFAKASDARKVHFWHKFWHPYLVVYAAAFGFEAYGRWIRSQRPPIITRYATWLMGRSLSYSTAKARQKLGWTPALGYEESIERSVRWYLEHESNKDRSVQRNFQQFTRTGT